MLSPPELRVILYGLDGKPTAVKGKQLATMRPKPVLRATILLGVNCAPGQTDPSGLPVSAFDQDAGCLD